MICRPKMIAAVFLEFVSSNLIFTKRWNHFLNEWNPIQMNAAQPSSCSRTKLWVNEFFILKKMLNGGRCSSLAQWAGRLSRGQDARFALETCPPTGAADSQKANKLPTSATYVRIGVLVQIWQQEAVRTPRNEWICRRQTPKNKNRNEFVFYRRKTLDGVERQGQFHSFAPDFGSIEINQIEIF